VLRGPVHAPSRGPPQFARLGRWPHPHTKRDLSRDDLEARADHVYSFTDVGAPMSSGWFLTRIRPGG
jgi:hypothetical protein